MPWENSRFIYLGLESGPSNRIEGGDKEMLAARMEGAFEQGDFDVLVAQTNSVLDANNYRINELPDQMRDALRDNVADYLASSFTRYDVDMSGTLDESEFMTYSNDMLGKLEDIIDQYAPTSDQLDAAKKAREERQESLDKAANAVQELRDIEIGEYDFDGANLKTPQGIHEELQKYTVYSARLRQKSAEISGMVSDFYGSYMDYQELLQNPAERWKRGVMQGVWSKLFPNDPDSRDREKDQLVGDLGVVKNVLNKKVPQLNQWGEDIARAGTAINDAGEALMYRKNKERGRAVDQVDDVDRGATERKEELAQNREELIEQQEMLAEQREGMKALRTELEAEAESLTEVQGDAAVTEGQLSDFEGRIDEAVGQIDKALEARMPRKKRKELEAKRDELLSQQGNVSSSLDNLALARIDMDAASRDIEQGISDAGEGVLTITDYLDNTLTPALESLDGAILSLDDALASNAEQRARVEMEYESVFGSIRELDALAAESVMENNLFNTEALTTLGQNNDFVQSVEIGNLNVLDGLSGGVEALFKTTICDKGLTRFSGMIRDVTKDIPVVNFLAGNSVGVLVDFPAGVLSGASDMVSSLVSLAAHPVEAGKGMSMFVGYDFNSGEWSFDNAKFAMDAMWKSFVDYENWAEGEDDEINRFRAFGYTGFNVLSTIMGVGAAAKMGKVAAVGSRVGSAGKGLAGMLRASGAYVKGFAKGLMANPAAFAKLPGSLMSGLARVFRNVGRLGDLLAVAKNAKSLGRTAIDASKKVVKQADTIADESGKVGRQSDTEEAMGIEFNRYDDERLDAIADVYEDQPEMDFQLEPTKIKRGDTFSAVLSQVTRGADDFVRIAVKNLKANGYNPENFPRGFNMEITDNRLSIFKEKRGGREYFQDPETGIDVKDLNITRAPDQNVA